MTNLTKPSRDKYALSFSEISEALRQFEFPPTELVIGIGSGGIVPATLVAHQLGCPLQIIHVNYRHEDNSPAYEAPRLTHSWEETAENWPEQEKILLVDDVSVSGKTIDFVKAKTGLTNAKIFVLKGKADFVLFPEIKQCVHWPWKKS